MMGWLCVWPLTSGHLALTLKPWQPLDVPRQHQRVEVRPQLQRELTAANKHASLYVPHLRPLCEVCRCHERHLIVGNQTLRVPRRASGAVQRETPRVVVDLRPTALAPRARQIAAELGQNRIVCPGVPVAIAADVKEQPDSESGYFVHASHQGRHYLSRSLNHKGAQENACVRTREQLL